MSRHTVDLTVPRPSTGSMTICSAGAKIVSVRVHVRKQARCLLRRVNEHDFVDRDAVLLQELRLLDGPWVAVEEKARFGHVR
jgi:hypothetical protein